MSAESFLAKLKKLDECTFLLPTLQEEIKYRKLDVIESSINGTMPNYIASRVLDVMRSGMSGKQQSEAAADDMSNDDVKEILVKATELWQKCVTDPVLPIEQIIEIPSEDRIAWFMDAVTNAQTSKTSTGGEVTSTEVANFSGKRANKGNSKRSTNSEVL